MVRQRRQEKNQGKRTLQIEGQCKKKQEAKMIMLIIGRTQGGRTNQTSGCMQAVSEGPCWDVSHFVNRYK